MISDEALNDLLMYYRGIQDGHYIDDVTMPDVLWALEELLELRTSPQFSVSLPDDKTE